MAAVEAKIAAGEAKIAAGEAKIAAGEAEAAAGALAAPTFFLAPGEAARGLYAEREAGEDSGVDLRFPRDVRVAPGATATIDLDLQVWCELGADRLPYALLPRSSIGKTELAVVSGPAAAWRAGGRALSVRVRNGGGAEFAAERGAALFQLVDDALRPPRVRLADRWRAAAGGWCPGCGRSYLPGEGPPGPPDAMCGVCGRWAANAVRLMPGWRAGPPPTLRFEDDREPAPSNTFALCSGPRAGPIRVDERGVTLGAPRALELGARATHREGLGVRAALTARGAPAGYYMRYEGPAGLVLRNVVGVIDRGYRGELIMVLHNPTAAPVRIAEGAPLAMLLPGVSGPCAAALVREDAPEFAAGATARGAGGFGSTGAAGRV